jgi:transposase InsO family protein
VVEVIISERKGLSGSMIRRELTKRGVIIGRDRFYKLIKRYSLTANSKRKAWKSIHYKLKAAKNLIYNRTYHRVYEVLLADYTEIETCEGKLQLLMVEDLISRYVTASRISKTCTAAPVIEALHESFRLKASLGLRYKTILHTDRGTEFVNHAVQNFAKENDVLLSNTGIHKCFDNPFMESLNKTLKHCLGLRVNFDTKVEAHRQINEAIKIYNNEHHHSGLGKRIPCSVLMNYTSKKSRKPEEKTGSCPPPGRGARTYAKSLTVKIKKIKIDKPKSKVK